MTEIKLTLDNPAGALQQLRHAAETLDFCEPLFALADSIEEQVKPPVDEPAEWGSLVLASSATCHNRVGWMRVFPSTKHYWENADGVTEAWTDLYRPEVLRVGIGEPGPLTEEEIALVLKDLAQWQSDAITAPEKRCYGMAIARVADLLGES